MNLTVIGTGYVGLVTGACFSETGNSVTCVDIDSLKISNLKEGVLPIYEPKLKDIVVDNYRSGRLKFTTSLKEAMCESELLFIAVGTPPGEDGSADLKYVLEVAKEIGRNLVRPSIIVDKSTVPIGTAEKVRDVIQQQLDERGVTVEFEVISNPEFLKEGAAVEDFMRPDRIVVGADSEWAKSVMAELYSPFTRNHPRLLFMGVRDAEMTKYAANAMLATKISFINEIANLCELMGVDVENIRLGIGSDQRIGFNFIYPGCGYGGSCFPKDVQALISMAESYDFEPKILFAVEERNKKQKNVLFEKVVKKYGADLRGKTFALWGLAFKPGTDDMRAAPSVSLINSLIESGARVKAYDPVASESAAKEFDKELLDVKLLEIVEGQYEAIIDADALILVTEWSVFRQPDFKAIKKLLKNPTIIDGRNQYDPTNLKDAGFDYVGIGR